jgi:hypothetical protein
MRKARKRREAIHQAENLANKIASGQPSWTVFKLRAQILFEKLLIPIKPLAIFAPHKRADTKRMDYNLLFLVLAVCANALVFVSSSCLWSESTLQFILSGGLYSQIAICAKGLWMGLQHGETSYTVILIYIIYAVY